MSAATGRATETAMEDAGVDPEHDGVQRRGDADAQGSRGQALEEFGLIHDALPMGGVRHTVRFVKLTE